MDKCNFKDIEEFKSFIEFENMTDIEKDIARNNLLTVIAISFIISCLQLCFGYSSISSRFVNSSF